MSPTEETIDATLDANGQLRLSHPPQLPPGPVQVTIRAAAPDATEVISYRVPTFKHHGGLVGFAGFEGHCSFFVMRPEVMEAHAEELKPYDTAKATIRFAPDQPLPDALVKKLVEARIKENEERASR